ncbi:hypothetical protein, partial [Roseovarius sp. SYSU LYC5161]|uniref:hypothetical protein n=1 Tax=Roseovarius halophilus (ex Wu et al. 2025) TaxID=3376060 RepID=UPI00399B8E5B
LSGEAHASNQGALISSSLMIGDTINSRLSQPMTGGVSQFAGPGAMNSFAAIEGEALGYAAVGKKRSVVDPNSPMAHKAPAMVAP